LSRLAPDFITSELVFQAAGNGDALALGIVDRVVYALGVGLTNVLHLYNPDLVVLGGGVTVGLNDLGLIPLIKDQMLDGAMSGLHKEFSLVASRLEDTAGMLGAAGLVWSAVDATA
jgi:glucokinase